MKIATQEEIDCFYEMATMDDSIYPFLTTRTYFGRTEKPKDDWFGVIMISKCGKCLLNVSFDRTRERLEFSVGLWAKNAYLAGKAIVVAKQLIQRYSPSHINSVVHSSNVKSLNLHKRIFGEPWGIEKEIAWNMKAGKMEDLYYFRKKV